MTLKQYNVVEKRNCLAPFLAQRIKRLLEQQGYYSNHITFIIHKIKQNACMSFLGSIVGEMSFIKGKVASNLSLAKFLPLACAKSVIT